jgi:CTP:molybdopterin cytidylyltransferase MocA
VSLHGLLLAAGAGTRMGTPKALMRDQDGTSWLLRSVAVLRAGGCDAVTVVLGAEAERARALLDRGQVRVVVADRWAEGMGESLRAGLAALVASDAGAVLVSLVDLPDVSADVVRRVAAAGAEPDLLARAAYDGEPGHPVLLGRHHWAQVADAATGDRGARDYLATHDVVLVECGDLATGRDRDSP